MKSKYAKTASTQKLPVFGSCPICRRKERGYLHKLSVTPWSDYRGRRYGIDTGTMAGPYGPQFNYTEAGPVNWASGFAVLTFHKGKLLQPELCVVSTVMLSPADNSGKYY